MNSPHRPSPLHPPRVPPGPAALVLLLVLIQADPARAAAPLHFNAPRDFVTCPLPSQIMPMDLDDDGDQDIVVACGQVTSGLQLQLFKNLGNGDYEFHSALSTPTTTESSVARWVAADFNGDGKQDLAKAYRSSALADTGKLNVYLRNGGFSFAQSTLDLDIPPGTICAGQLDGAGGADLVIADNRFPEVYSYLSEGGAAFTRSGPYATEDLSRDIDGDGTPDTQSDFHGVDCQISDLDGDGDGDLAYTNGFVRKLSASHGGGHVNNIVRLPNQGAGSLGPYQILRDQMGRELAAADMDGDGDRDIVTVGVSLAGPDGYTIIVLPNTGGGGFGPEQRFASGGGAGQIGRPRLADIDGDGDMDVGVPLRGPVSGNVNDHLADAWALLRNDGHGGLGQPELWPAGADIFDLEFANVDGMAGPEALSLAGDDARFAVYYNRSGQYLVPTAAKLDDPRAVTKGTTLVAVADVDVQNDGRQDLAIITNHSHLVADGPDTLVLLDGGSLSATRIDLSQRVPSRVLAGQLAGAAAKDFAVLFMGSNFITDSTPPGVGVLLGNNSFQPAPMKFTPLNATPEDFAALEVNGDGVMDMAVLRYRLAGELTAGVSILAMAGDGGLAPLAEITLGSNSPLSIDQRFPDALAAADMDGDGRKDLLAVTEGLFGSTYVRVLLNKGGGVFEAAGNEAVLSRRGALDAIAADVDGDGRADAVLAMGTDVFGNGSGTVVVLPNLGAGQLGGAVSYAIGGAPVQIVAAQIDGAKGLDLLAVDDLNNEVVLLLNDGSGGFSKQQRYLAGGGADGLAVAELNQDGYLDVAVINDNDVVDKHHGTVSLLAGRSLSPSYPLKVAVAGRGTVRDPRAGFSCAADCSRSYPEGADVTLSATPAAGYRFAGWAGDCAGAGPCTLSLTSAKAVTATFNAAPVEYALAVAKTGQGTVASVPAGIDCGAACKKNFVKGTAVALAATPASGYVFAGWQGACAGGGDCNLTMDSAKQVTAVFAGKLTQGGTAANLAGAAGSSQFFTIAVPANATALRIAINGGQGDADLYVRQGTLPTLNQWDCRPALPGNAETCVFPAPAAGNYYAMLYGRGAYAGVALTVSYAEKRFYALTVAARGQGSVASAPAGINCGADCGETYPADTRVQLKAVPAGGFSFVGWSGACNGPNPECAVSVDAAKSATANFAWLHKPAWKRALLK